MGNMRGYFEIGVWQGKASVNVGTLWRSAYQLGAAGIFTVGQRYPKQASDTIKAWRHLPYREFTTLEELHTSLPYSCSIVGIEIGGKPLKTFRHPERCLYLLGAEDHGLTEEALRYCHYTVSLAAVRTYSFNVAVAGSIVMYDRFQKDHMEP